MWFITGALQLVVVMEVLAARLDSPKEYTAAVPAVAIVPFFFAGSPYPITSPPHWLTYVAKALPLTHALAVPLRTDGPGWTGSAHIWGTSSVDEMAALSVLVLVSDAALATFAALRAFKRKRRCTV